jgi:hypothetical protein
MDTNGTFAGQVHRLNGVAGLMGSSWPTLQGGNRGDGRVHTNAWELVQLPPYGVNYPQSPWADVRSVTPAGLALGYSLSPYGYLGAIWRNSQATWLGGPIVADSVAVAGNSSGHVVGWHGYYTRVPALWLNAGATNASRLNLPMTGLLHAYASDINQSGFIVGYGIDSNNITSALRWDTSAQSMTRLGTLAGNTVYVYAMTDLGRVAGAGYFAGNGPLRAFITPSPPAADQLNEQSIDLGSVAGPSGSSGAWDAHDNGGIVGWTHVDGGNPPRAFRVTTNSLAITAASVLPALPGNSNTNSPWSSAAYGVNRWGHTVGTGTVITGSATNSRAFLFRPELPAASCMQNLNDHPAVQGSGWTLTSALSVNDSGVIVGRGIRAGASAWWLLRPGASIP